jgi:hypothetical protein
MGDARHQSCRGGSSEAKTAYRLQEPPLAGKGDNRYMRAFAAIVGGSDRYYYSTARTFLVALRPEAGWPIPPLFAVRRSLAPDQRRSRDQLCAGRGRKGLERTVRLPCLYRHLPRAAIWRFRRSDENRCCKRLASDRIHRRSSARWEQAHLLYALDRAFGAVAAGFLF